MFCQYPSLRIHFSVDHQEMPAMGHLSKDMVQEKGRDVDVCTFQG